MPNTRILSKAIVLALVSLALLSSLNIQVVNAQTLSYPDKGEINYPPVPKAYRPWTPKEAIIPAWINLANQHNGTYESIGNASGTQNWDIIAFRFGNASKPAIMVDAHLHGNEQYGYEVMYSLANWLVSGDEAADRILQNNSVIFIPVLNYNWDRENLNDVDLNRNFAPSWNSTFTRTEEGYNAGTTADSEPESQALITAWTRYQPRIYWNLHQGSTNVYTDGRATTTQQTTDLKQLKSILPTIASSLNITGPLIDNFYISSTYGSGHNGFGKGFAVDGASSHGVAGLMTELKGGWKYTNTIRSDLNSGETYQQAKALFIAMTQAIEEKPQQTPDPQPSLTDSLDLVWKLSIILAIVASAFLLASELLSPYYGQIKTRINKDTVQKIALLLATLFGFTIFIRIMSVIFNFA